MARLDSTSHWKDDLLGPVGTFRPIKNSIAYHRQIQPWTAINPNGLPSLLGKELVVHCHLKAAWSLQ